MALTFLSFLVLLCALMKECLSIDTCSNSIGSSTELTSFGILDYEQDVYINTKSATSCGGYLRNVSYCAAKPYKNRKFNSGVIFLMEPTATEYRYEVVQASIFDVQELNTSNGCSDEYQKEYLVDITNNPNSNGSKYFECKWHCYNESIFLEQGSVLGYKATQQNLGRGQIIVENVLKDQGLCQASVVQFDADVIDTVQCIAFNTMRTLLINASIDVAACVVLPPPEYGSVNVTTLASVAIGDSVEYTCDSGYEMQGQSLLTCLESDDSSNDGYWDGTVPLCNTTHTPSSATNNSLRISIAATILAVFVICVAVICILAVLLAYRTHKSGRFSRTDVNNVMLTATTNPININGSSLSSNQDKMGHKDEIDSPGFEQDFDNTLDTTSPYSYVTTTKVSHYLTSHDPPPLPPSHPSSCVDDPMLHYEVEDESPYWAPANVEKEVFLQLETISVKLIQNCDVNIKETLGSGQFSVVKKGEWFNNGTCMEVAVKHLRQNTPESKVKLLQEAATMGQFKHSNVLKLFGVVTDSAFLLLIVEYMSEGNLQSILVKMRPQAGVELSQNAIVKLLSYCRQVCLGMTYLSVKGFVHRDIAARNILVSGNGICKISDFGMSRDVCDDYYVAQEGQPIPLRWTAPESLTHHKYSIASDVWSYGCLLYEIWSLGYKPYTGMSNADIIKTIRSGKRLSPPPGCSRVLYDTMIKCWNPTDTERPSFHDLMLLLLQQDQDILTIPEEDRRTHPKAGVVGADLAAGQNMYKDLQNKYIK